MESVQKIQKLIAILITMNLLSIMALISMFSYQIIHTNNTVFELKSDIASHDKVLNDVNASTVRIEGQLKFVIGHMFKVDNAK